jgi:uncharacterized coiled-coil protein SlyX
MLGAANTELSTRAAAEAARNKQLSLQLDVLTERMTSGERALAERDAALVDARRALRENEGTLVRLAAHVAALEQQLLAKSQDAQKSVSGMIARHG